jgi:phenylacetate-CoA ligase
LLAEEINRRGIKDKINLRIGIFGSERWGNHMRQRIESLLNIETFDIYGLTEIYGPGIGIDCPEHTGMHYWWDHLLFEIIDPNTGEQLPQGEQGELVITTLTKEGMPLIRFRTRDITRILKGQCPCGLNFPRIEKVLGRTDDRIKVKGVNIYPGQLECVIDMTEGASSEYQLIITRQNAKDHLLIKIEVEPEYDADHVAQQLQKNIKTHIGITTEVEGVPLGTLPRTTKKSKRIFDHREY